MWLNLAWKNLWRNKNRTAITISGIFFAMIISVTASSLQNGVFDNFIRNLVGYYTGYIQIHRQGYWDHPELDNGLERNVAHESAVKAQKNVTAVAPRIESYALASYRDVTKGCMVVGISPEEENMVTALKQKISAGHYFASGDTQDVLLADGLSDRLKLGVGDTLYLIGQGYHGALAAGKYAIKGLLTFGSPELNDQLLFMPLGTAQEFFTAPGLVTSYVIGMSSDKSLAQTVRSLAAISGEGYEVMSWKELLPEVEQHIRMDKGSMYIILGILYLLICFGIFGTMLMMLAERRHEMGMLVAVGMKKRKLAGLLLIESILAVLIGSVLGLICSIPLVWYLNTYPIRIGGEMAEAYKQFNFEPVFPASTDPSNFLTQGIIIISLGFLLSIYPVVKALRLDAVEAMKK